jgi:hypothetical protein
VNDHVINALISLAFFTLAALLLWVLVRMNVRERARRDAVDQRARAARLPSRSTSFNAGALAALDGIEAWENPHCSPSSSKDDGAAWAAGWCHGRQLLRDAARSED